MPASDDILEKKKTIRAQALAARDSQPDKESPQQNYLPLLGQP